MIASEEAGFAVADEVAAGIAGVGDRGAVIAEGAGDEGGRHTAEPAASS